MILSPQNPSEQAWHIPVMVNEVLGFIKPKNNTVILDATLGYGGHSKEILSRFKNIRLIGIDQDIDAIKSAEDNLKAYKDRIELVNDNFNNIRKIIESRNIKLCFALFDLGVSSYQIDNPERGFSFQSDSILDMRMNRSSPITAEDLINSLDKNELEQVILEYGEERHYKRIASAIINKRPVHTTRELSNIIRMAIPKTTPINTTKSIARVFQAIRIKVNDELNSLKKALSDTIDLLVPGGRIVVISYHSLEDRIVKDRFRESAKGCICPPKQPICTCTHEKKLTIITKKPLTPTGQEISENPRSRSAKLRAAEKT